MIMKERFFVYLVAGSAGLLSAVNVLAQDTTTLGQDIKKLLKNQVM